MCDVWTGQRNRPLRLLAVAAGEQGEWMAREIGGKEEKAPFCLMQSGADQAAGAELLYLTVGAEAYREVAELARWARQRGALVLWNPGGLKNARILPAQGCVTLQSALSPEEELSALHELFCTPSLATTLDRRTLMQRLWAASRASLALAQASGGEKNQSIAASLAAQDWQMPKERALVVSIGASVDCRLEEVVELWHGTVKQTRELEVLWGSAFDLEQPDSLRLVLMAVEP